MQLINNRCILCNGNSGQLINGTHSLCLARSKRGLVIAQRGDSCVICGGTGIDLSKRLRAYNGLIGVINPSGYTLDTIDKLCKCHACNGKG